MYVTPNLCRCSSDSHCSNILLAWFVSSNQQWTFVPDTQRHGLSACLPSPTLAKHLADFLCLFFEVLEDWGQSACCSLCLTSVLAWAVLCMLLPSCASQNHLPGLLFRPHPSPPYSTNTVGATLSRVPLGAVDNTRRLKTCKEPFDYAWEMAYIYKNTTKLRTQVC